VLSTGENGRIAIIIDIVLDIALIVDVLAGIDNY
jgi:hypothetical protein